MSTISYTDPANIHAICDDKVTPRNPYATGYGCKAPTSHRIQYGPAKRWHRVYVMVYCNSGSAYILHRGETLFLDTDTEYAFEGVMPEVWQ